LLGLYECTRDWQQAIAIAHQLESAERGSFQPRVAHYWCELAQDAIAQRDPQAARKHLEMALQVNPASARARLDLCTLLEKQQALPEAFAQLLALAEQAPAALPLAAAPLAQLALKLERTAEARDVLTQAQSVAPSLDHVEALVALLPAEETHTSGELFLAHLRRESSIVVAADWLQAESDATASPLPTEVSKALNRTTAPQRRYRCAACGFEAARHFWQCPGCQTWDSYSPRRVDEL
jgi:lipopolysaccharide biosynthesis regulator YciM